MTNEEIIQGLYRGDSRAIKEAIKALEQPTINSNITTEEIAQSFKADVETVKDYLPKCNSMEFPKTFDEFANDYGFTDDKEIYTNGSHLIPVFRVKQWLDHIEQQPSDDCISRQAVLNKKELIELPDGQSFYCISPEDVESLPPVTPTTHGTCKDCKHCCFITGTKNRVCEKHGCMQVSNNWYCADFEKRGSENESK